MSYAIVDIETCPLNLEGYFELDEETQKTLLNPIDSRIVAVGIKYEGKDRIMLSGNEKELLHQFWNEWREIKKGDSSAKIIGFNIKNFDLPFLTARSFINDIVIEPFLIKNVIDLREKINAYRYGHTRGKLKEYAVLLGEKIMDINGGDVARLWNENKHDAIKEYLAKDLKITELLYRRAVKTRIIEIERW